MKWHVTYRHGYKGHIYFEKVKTENLKYFLAHFGLLSTDLESSKHPSLPGYWCWLCPFMTTFSFDHWHQQGILPREHPLAEYFLGPFSLKPKDGCAWKSQHISSFWNTIFDFDYCGTNNYGMPKSLKWPFFPILLLSLNFSRSSWSCVHA